MPTPSKPTSSHPPRRLSYAGIAVAAVAIGAFVAWFANGRMEAERQRLAEAAVLGFGVDRTNVPAPPIELASLDGGHFSLSGSRGQVVFVNFWATWCPPCREEMPSMVRLGQELAARYPGRFRMVAVSVDEAVNPVQEFFGGPPYGGRPGVTVLLDPGQVATRAYYCAARGGVCPDLKFPESYIVDASGQLVAFVIGPRDWSEPAARAFLESLIRS